MNINPETLLEETDEERFERQRRTGVLGSGHYVLCKPDPQTDRLQHRSVCLGRPYPACVSCPHRDFVLFFDANPRQETIACPRWTTDEEYARGVAPYRYVPVEPATCRERPYSFCKSCPKREDLYQLGIEKSRPGWYGRWARLSKES